MRVVERFLRAKTGRDGDSEDAIHVSDAFVAVIDGATATMDGRMVINRMDFGVGASVTDDATLAAEVAIEVALTATRTE